MLQITGDTIQERFQSAVKGLRLRFPATRIAEKTGYNKTTVSEYLNNKEPSEAFLRTFAEHFKVDFDTIWSGKPEIENEPDQTIKGILGVLAKAFQSQTEILKSIESKMAQESTQAKILKAITDQEFNFSRSDKNQLGLASLVGELLLRDFSREAKGNPDAVQKILQDFLRRIGSKLSPDVKESIGADGRT